MFQYLKSKKINKENDILGSQFITEDILVEYLDYYYSNVISRASITMTQCRNDKLKLKKTGTEG